MPQAEWKAPTVHILDLKWTTIVESPGRLLSRIDVVTGIGGSHFYTLHVEAVRVIEKEDGWHAFDDGDEDTLDRVLLLTGDNLPDRTHLPEHEGEWVIWCTPGC